MTQHWKSFQNWPKKKWETWIDQISEKNIGKKLPLKKVEHQRIDAFELWCWKRLLRVPLTARRSNQSILKEISPEYSLEGLMLKLKLQYFGHLMRRNDSLEKTLMLGKIEGRRRRGWKRRRWLNGITDLLYMSLSKLRELVMNRETWYAAVHGVLKSWTWLSDWTDWTVLKTHEVENNFIQETGATTKFNMILKMKHSYVM